MMFTANGGMGWTADTNASEGRARCEVCSVQAVGQLVARRYQQLNFDMESLEVKETMAHLAWIW